MMYLTLILARSIGALVRLDNGAGAEIYILNDTNGQISLAHTIELEKRKKGKKEKKPTKLIGGRGRPAARHEDEEENDDQDEDGEDDEEDEDDNDDLDDDEEDNEDQDQDEEEDYEVPKFRQTGYQNFVLGGQCNYYCHHE